MLSPIDVVPLFPLLYCVPWHASTGDEHLMFLNLGLFIIRLNILKHVSWCTCTGRKLFWTDAQERSGWEKNWRVVECLFLCEYVFMRVVRTLTRSTLVTNI